MLSMTVSDLIRATGATPLVHGTGTVCGEVVIDSRKVEEGSVFVAFVGERVDGNNYALGAVRSGAGAVILSAPPAEGLLDEAEARGCAVLRAEDDDCEEFMLRLASEWISRHPQWLVVGVTGSVGKTTTKDMLRAAIGAARPCHATAGNFNNLIGMPLTALNAPEDIEVLILELGMNHTGEIDRLARACRPSVAVITNVGTSHIGLLGSRENIARAKAEICVGMRENAGVGPTLVMTSSGDFTRFIAEGFARPAGVEVVTVGSASGDALSAHNVTIGSDGCASLTLVASDGWSRQVGLKVPGRQVVADALLALQAAFELGIDRDLAAEAVAAMPAARMRLSVLRTPGKPTMIDDSYNASPNSMAAALDVLQEMECDGRKVAVLGEIGELGDEAVRLHELVGAYAASKPLDMLVLVGTELAGHMAEAARIMGFSDDKIYPFATVEDAVSTLSPVFGENDVVLVKASRSAGLDAFVRGVLA